MFIKTYITKTLKQTQMPISMRMNKQSVTYSCSETTLINKNKLLMNATRWMNLTILHLMKEARLYIFFYMEPSWKGYLHSVKLSCKNFTLETYTQ